MPREKVVRVEASVAKSDENDCKTFLVNAQKMEKRENSIGDKFLLPANLFPSASLCAAIEIRQSSFC